MPHPVRRRSRSSHKLFIGICTITLALGCGLALFLTHARANQGDTSRQVAVRTVNTEADVDTLVSEKTFGIGLGNGVTSTQWPLEFGSSRGPGYSGAWKFIEPERGRFNWPIFDRWVTSQVAQKKDVMFLMSGTPDWAVSAPSVGKPPLGGKSNQPPDNFDDWSDFWTAVTRRAVLDGAKGAVYEGWNEADTPQYFVGTMSQLATLQRLQYQAVKAVDPTARIVSTSFTAHPENFAKFMASSDGASGTGKDWFDIAGYHFYVYDSQSAWRVAQDAMAFRKVLDTAGVTKPIWCSEVGLLHPQYGTMPPRLRQDILTSYFTSLLATGVSRVFWHQYHSGSDNMGFVDVSDTDNWNALTTQLIGKQIVHGETVRDPVNGYSVKLWFKDGTTKTFQNLPQ